MSLSTRIAAGQRISVSSDPLFPCCQSSVAGTSRFGIRSHARRYSDLAIPSSLKLLARADTLQHQLYTYSDRSGEPENQRTGAEETEWSGRQRQREPEEFHSQTRSEQKHQECTKRSPTLEAVHVPRSGGGAGTPGACRTRIEVRATLGSTGTAT